MVALVLHDAGVETGYFAQDRTPARISAFIAQLRVARHDTAQAGNRKTALPALFHRWGEWRQDRIDKLRIGDGLGIGIAWIALDAEDDHAQRHADLRGGETGAALRRHGVAHILEQKSKLRRVEALDLRRALPQPRIAHAQHFAYHAGSSAASCSSKVRTRSMVVSRTVAMRFIDTWIAESPRPAAWLTTTAIAA